MENIELMNTKEYLQDLLHNPYDSKERKYNGCSSTRTYYLIDKFEYRKESNLLKGDIHCYLSDNYGGPSGCVTLNIDIEALQHGKDLHFHDLLVPTNIENNGIGKYLMQIVIEHIRSAKELFGVTDTISLRGWLSVVDAKNWEKSLPVYQKVADLEKVKYYFEAKDNTTYTDDKSFSSYAINNKIDGAIVYFI